ncbi:MAG: ATP-binding protein [Myxococcota bacterium]
MVWEPAIFDLPRGEWSPQIEADMLACEDPIWAFDSLRHQMVWANAAAVTFWNAESFEELTARDYGVDMSRSTRRRLGAYRRIVSRGEQAFDRWTVFPGGRPTTVLTVVRDMPSKPKSGVLLMRARLCDTAQGDLRGVEALRHTSVMITMCTPEGQVLMENPAAAAAFGFLQRTERVHALRDRVVSTTDADVIHVALGERGEFSGELRVQTSAGVVWHGIDVLVTSDPATGKRALLINERDIDARKRGEIELAKTRAELEVRVVERTRDLARQQAFVEAILDTARTLMFVADASGRVVRGNQALQDFLGTEPAAASMSAWEVFGDGTAERFRRWIECGAMAEDLEVERVSAAGTRTVLYWTAQVLHVDGEHFLVASGLDITERRELQLQLQTADRMSSIGTLASGVAHELNNPLAFALTSVELAQASAKSGDAESVLPHLDAAAEACERVARIVADLKGFALPPGPTTEVNLRVVVDSATRMMSHRLLERRMLSVDVDGDVWVSGDETKLCQVVLNLLINAAQAVEHSGAEASIAVSAEASGGWVSLTVDDTGEGIAPQVLGRIFDPFFTTKGHREGTGLGLAISHRIIAQFGGSIAVESRHGEGSTFTVRLPEAASPIRRLSEATRERSVPRARVLIVDDEPGLADAFAHALPRHDVVTATSGHEALQHIASQTFDVIVCDLMMPEIGGREVYGAVAARDEEAAARMLFVTGDAFTEEAQAFVREMGERVLYKPISARALRDSVAEVLELAGPRRRDAAAQ